MDASCGLATVASALSLYWHVPVSESELLVELFPPLSGLDEKHDGTLSLASMAVAFQGRAVSAKAFRLDWTGLEETLLLGYAPLVVHYDRPEPHFALLLSISDGIAVLADPARGLETLSKTGFERRYSGVAMALASPSMHTDVELLAAGTHTATSRRLLCEQAAVLSWSGRLEPGSRR